MKRELLKENEINSSLFELKEKIYDIKRESVKKELVNNIQIPKAFNLITEPISSRLDKLTERRKRANKQRLGRDVQELLDEERLDDVEEWPGEEEGEGEGEEADRLAKEEEAERLEWQKKKDKEEEKKKKKAERLERKRKRTEELESMRLEEKRKKTEELVKEKKEAEQSAEAEVEKLEKKTEEAKRLVRKTEVAEQSAKESEEAGELAKGKKEAELLAREEEETERSAKEKVERLAKEREDPERLQREVEEEAKRLDKEKEEAKRLDGGHVFCEGANLSQLSSVFCVFSLYCPSNKCLSVYLMMSATRKGKKQAEEPDFETFVRETLHRLCKDVEEIKEGQAKIQSDVSLLKSKVSNNEKELKSIKNLTESLRTNFEELNGDLHEAKDKLEEVERDVGKNAKMTESLNERIVAMERYSREYNLRFFNIPESPGENCIDKLGSILSEDLNIRPVIENAHRIGVARNAESPRPIIAKFIYRPERFQVYRKRKDLQNGVWLSEDLTYEDRQKKKGYRDVMKEAFEQGKKPRFHHGRLYIDGVEYKG